MRKIFVFISLFFFAGLALTPTAFVRAEDDYNPFADSAEFIESFHADLTVRSDASLLVKETIVYNFGDLERHGIFRDLPTSYSSPSGTLYTAVTITAVTNQDNQPIPYELEDFGYSLRVRIGDPDTTVTGQHTYHITYVARGVVPHFEDHDEVYWNVTGNDWPVPMKKITATVTLPKAFPLSALSKKCYQGYTGSITSCDSSTFNTSSSQLITTASFTANNVETYDGLTVVVGFPAGHIPVVTPRLEPYAPAEIVPNGFFARLRYTLNEASSGANNPLIFFLPLLVFIYMLAHWWSHGRDKAGHGVIVAEFTAPDKLSPAQVGLLVKGKTRPIDVSAEIIHLAVQGYLTITRIPKTGLLGSDDFIFTKKKGADGLRSWQKTLFEEIFTKKKIEIKVSELRYALSTIAMDFMSDISETFVEKKYYEKDPWQVKFAYYLKGAGVGMLISLPGALLGWMWIVAGLMSAFIVIFIGFLMPVRTVLGSTTREHALGLKLYLSVAEKDRLAFHNAPTADPKHFEALLPYAMVLGVEEAWAKHFADMQTESPEWYSDPTMKTFSALAITNGLSTFSSRAANTMLTSRPSKSSGSSGGSGLSSGSSGGGFGGGGGGSW
jgi:uncharacterized membrane protein YgcG